MWIQYANAPEGPAFGISAVRGHIQLFVNYAPPQGGTPGTIVTHPVHLAGWRFIHCHTNGISRRLETHGIAVRHRNPSTNALFGDFASVPNIIIFTEEPTTGSAGIHALSSMPSIKARNINGVIHRELRSPWHFVAIAAMVQPAWIALRHLRRKQSLRDLAGHCEQCGYDIHATPDRCPECGVIPPTKRLTQ